MKDRRLVLLRHAKATASGASDAKRPLASRGAADAAAVGRQLTGQQLAPDRVVVSPALRARQTWQLAAAELPRSPDPVTDDRVYGNTVEELLAVLRDTPADVETLIVVGHNPSIEGLATVLDDGQGPAEARSAIATKYPTSGVTVFAVTVAWPEVGAGAGMLLSFTAPGG